MELFTQTEKKEEKDELHKEYGVVSNCIYILKRFKKYRPSLIFFIITGAAAAASMSYIWSFIGKLVIDMIQSSAAGGDIMPLVKLVAATTAAELFIMWLNTVSTVKTGLGFTYVRLMIIKERIAKTLDMDYEALETPEMLDRLQKAKRATAGDWQGVQGMMTYMQVLFTQIISIIIAIIIMTSFDPLIILVIAVLSYIQFLYFEHIRKKDKKEMWDAMMPHWRKLEYMENVTTDFSYAKDIRLFGMKKFLAKKQKDVYDEELRHWIKSRQYWIYNSIFSHSISLVRQLIITGWLVYSVIAKDLSIGNFTLYLASAGAFSNAINEVLSALSALRERSAHTDDYRSFMDIPCDSGKDTIPVPKADKYVFTFENVSFKYKGQEKYALKNLNITIAAGEKLAVVGLNGAGKSTFIKLLLRLYDVTEGRILMNGTDISRFDRAEYYRLFSPAFQDVTVFAFPMAENVSMSPPDETDKNKAEKCVREAGLGDKMDKLEKGIDTELLKVLYDDGVDLSGGEKQKLALARALYKGSDIIVLDEPTAALDALAEYRLYKSFNGLVGNRTAVYISHRLSSTRFCDKVAMFKDGEMTETGTHEELMAKNGDYAEMFRVQAQYYVEDGDIFDTAPAEAVTD
ncbi:MAG: ABC transporter ATP-binding protein [Oscillospiraceae bacterium]|nr:ABC transporter ATP-binding protein [Oscillospiraceae bacterium]MDY2864515.1 ABC transporter ATP-binding protein [Oscillospiraceae bacterium]